MYPYNKMDLPEIILVEPEYEINVEQLSVSDYRSGINCFSGLYKKAQAGSIYVHEFEPTYIKQGTTAKVAIGWHEITSAWCLGLKFVNF